MPGCKRCTREGRRIERAGSDGFHNVAVELILLYVSFLRQVRYPINMNSSPHIVFRHGKSLHLLQATMLRGLRNAAMDRKQT